MLQQRGLASLFGNAKCVIPHHNFDHTWYGFDAEWGKPQPVHTPLGLTLEVMEDSPHDCGSIHCASSLQPGNRAQEYAKRVWNAFNFSQYRILKQWFSKIATLADSFDLALEIDAISSRAHARLPRHWSRHSNAFDKFWGDTVLWMHPPPKLIECAVEKILRDEARGATPKYKQPFGQFLADTQM